jgi:2-oxo-4-hydroxy-4-carboxy-5-ureidoimidazoline decarboxylase
VSKLTIDQVNALSREDFVARFGFLFEHSPWVTEDAAQHRPFETAGAMHAALARVLFFADDEQKLAVFRAHPKLADKAAIKAGLTKESASEQASAGLDALTPEEFEQFNVLNAAYDTRFGFPFIIAVRAAGGKAGVLMAMRERLDNNDAQERRNALDEVVKIVGLRLQDVVEGEWV